MLNSLVANLAALFNVTLQWVCRDSKQSLSFFLHLESIATEKAVQEKVHKRLISIQSLILSASLGCSSKHVKLNETSSKSIFSTTSACSGRSCRTVINSPTMFNVIRGVFVSVTGRKICDGSWRCSRWKIMDGDVKIKRKMWISNKDNK